MILRDYIIFSEIIFHVNKSEYIAFGFKVFDIEFDYSPFRNKFTIDLDNHVIWLIFNRSNRAYIFWYNYDVECMKGKAMGKIKIELR